jgi:murein DD-endopeptidase MepM/ murein hydrolase activator NlpD
MTARIRFLFFFLAFAAAGGFAQETLHIVQKGETIYSIARNYGAGIQEVLNLNGIQDPKKVQAGQRIKIPGNGGPSGKSARDAAPAEYVEYLVVRGDSIFGIARKYGVTMKELRTANRLGEDYVLKAGDRLKIPQNGKAPVIAIGGNLPTGPVETGATVRPAGNGGLPNGGAAVQPVAQQTAPVSSASGILTAGGQELWPVQVKELAYMTGKLYGVAILGERSEPVRSLSQGTVISAGPYRGFGRVAIVQMTGGYLYVYGGCESLSVKEGDRVLPGTEIGRLGLDGATSKPQLFLMVYKNNTPIDPAKAPRT